MAQDSAQLNTTRVFASLVVLGLCGMAFFGSITLIERLCMPWAFGGTRRRPFGTAFAAPRPTHADKAGQAN
jgi:hypothetical protein